MKLEDLYLINKEEWLDVIKDKCKKKAKTHFWVGLVSLILLLIMVTIAIYVELHPDIHYSHEKRDYVLLLALVLLAIMSGWWVIKSYSFLKTIDGLGTPEQLLNKFKKYVKDRSIIWTIGSLIFYGWFFVYFTLSPNLGIIEKVITCFISLAGATLYISRLIRGKYFVVSSDGDITRRLQELIGEE